MLRKRRFSEAVGCAKGRGHLRRDVEVQCAYEASLVVAHQAIDMPLDLFF